MEARDFFDRYVNLERSHLVPYPLKLERMRHLVRLLGLPAKSFGVITVAGSKGKGSAAAMIASLLAAQGGTTGFYSSPHLFTWHERIRVNGVPITENEARAVVEFLEHRMEGADFPYGPPTYFEVMTAAAFLYFRDRGVETAVLEVGMGGEFDATNALDADVAVIMPIGMEHVAQLGPTLESIASAKCGILRRGGAAVVALQTGEAMRIIEERAAETGARLFSVGKEIEIRDEDAGEESQRFSLRGQWGKEGPFEIRLLGRHQLENAAAAYLAYRKYLDLKGKTAGFIAEGFRGAVWPARVEKAADSPAVVIDGAHTFESAQALVAAIRRHFRPGRIELVLGMLDDKDPAKFLEPFRGLIRRIWLVPVRNERSFTPSRLKERIGDSGFETREASLTAAVDAARAAAGAEGLVVVTGSLYLAAEAKEHLDATLSRR